MLICGQTARPGKLILAGMEKVQHDDLRVLQPQPRLSGFVLLGEFLNPERRLHADRLGLADREWNVRDPAALPSRVDGQRCRPNNVHALVRETKNLRSCRPD